MRKKHLLVPILTLIVSHFAVSQGPTPTKSTAPNAASHKLKSVDLANGYTIDVPESFTVQEASHTDAPAYVLRAAPSHCIEIIVLPYDFWSRGISIDEKTGIVKLPVRVNGGPPLKSYFKIRRDQYAYYGWSVADTAYACTINSACPHPVPRKLRYQTEYAFVVFDDPNIVEFRALNRGPARNVTQPEGDGKLLRDVIVPSLR